MTSEYEQRRAERAERIREGEQSARDKEIIVGEMTGTVEADISSGQELKIKIHGVDDLVLSPSMDLKTGDTLKITVKADPSLSEHHEMDWKRRKPEYTDEASGVVKGKIKANHDLGLKIDRISVSKAQSSAELDKGDSIRINIEKS